MRNDSVIRHVARIAHIFKISYLQVHDEVKDKMFELELSWVGEFTDGVHKRVPDDVSYRIDFMFLTL